MPGGFGHQSLAPGPAALAAEVTVPRILHAFELI